MVIRYENGEIPNTISEVEEDENYDNYKETNSENNIEQEEETKQNDEMRNR